MLSNKSELFVEVVEEEQEVISGGNVDFGTLSAYFTNAQAVSGSTIATPAGASASGTAVNQIIGSLSLQGIRVF
ncbi:hypothetical protein NIES4101_43100 [Calothrix sp. NIES-4101]|nr:hypothetical protein NIES4101_43100 [Calothrix sp. NIES-4101]